MPLYALRRHGERFYPVGRCDMNHFLVKNPELSIIMSTVPTTPLLSTRTEVGHFLYPDNPHKRDLRRMDYHL